jgi:hypothetical protein
MNAVCERQASRSDLPYRDQHLLSGNGVLDRDRLSGRESPQYGHRGQRGSLGWRGVLEYTIIRFLPNSQSVKKEVIFAISCSSQEGITKTSSSKALCSHARFS